MPYIGPPAPDRFVAPKAAKQFSGDGSTTAFTLDHAVGSDEDILVSVDGVIQEPSVAYAVSNGTTLTFTAAPSSNSGNNIFVYYLFRTVGTVSHPSNNALTASTGTFSGAVSVSGATTLSGNLGIGATTIDSDIHIEKSSDLQIKLERTGSGTSTISVPSSGQLEINNTSNAAMTFSTNNTERFRADNSGNILFSTTGTPDSVVGSSGAGMAYEANGFLGIARAGTPLIINRRSTYGNLIVLKTDGTDRGGIGVGSGNVVYVGGGDVFLAFFGTGDSVYPATDSGGGRDNAIDLGTSSVRFQTLYATTSSINTSDKNEKQDIEELTDAEKRVAVVAKGLLRKYRWKDAVAKKGDNARIHFGIIAQDLQDAFTAESLDASRYGMFCSNTWWEKEISVDAVEADEEKGIEAKDAYTYMDIKEEATEGYTEKTRLGVRYSELLAFIISAI